MAKCNICKGEHSLNNLRMGACWDCMELQSVLTDGEDVYDKKIANNEMSVNSANKIIEWMTRKGWYNISKHQQNKLESLSPFPKWRYNWFAIPFYRLACWIQVLLWKKGIHTHNIISRECTPDFSCCASKWKSSGMEHIKDAIVKSTQQDGGILVIKNVDHPN